MRAEQNKKWLAAGTALLFATGFFIYWPAVRGDFLWDDVLNIATNPLLRTERGLLTIWLGGKDVYDYYPLTWTTWWLEWHAWHRDTFGYHVFNILLHAGAAALIWRVLVRLSIPGAFVAALIFVVHPVHVESVAWITERKNTLSMFCLAATMVLYLDGEAATDGRRKRWLYWGAFFGFVLTVLAKPSVVLLPAGLLGIAWWKKGRLERRDVIASVPFWITAAAVSVVTVVVHHGRGIVTSEIRTDGFLSRLVGSAWGVWFYIYKLVWPTHISFVYPRWKLNPASPVQWMPLAALAIVALGLYLAQRSWTRATLAALCWFVAMLLPVLGFVDVYFMRFSFVADHWQYAASIGVIALIAAAGATAIDRFPERVRRPVGVLATAIVCGLFGFQAWREAHVYQTNEMLWQCVVNDDPNSPIARINYGGELAARGAIDAARQNYKIALELDPRSRETYVLMGRTYLMEHQPEQALPWFRAAIGKPGGGLNPQIALADALTGTGHVQEAMQLYEAALAADPVAGSFRGQLAGLYELKGDPVRALQLYRDAATAAPDEVEPAFVLAEALLRFKYETEAEQALAEACRLCDDDPSALAGIGSRLLVAGHKKQAADVLRDVTRRRPDYGPAFVALGAALEADGRNDEAAAAYEEAARRLPTFREVRESLRRVRGEAPATTQSTD